MLEFSPEWFDESSKSWRANKKRVGESWKYVCSADMCKRVCPQILGEHEHLCTMHSKHSKHTSSQRVTEACQVVPQKPLLQEKRRSPRLLPPLASKPASSQETYPSTRTSQRLRKAESQAAQPGPAVAHRAVRKLRASPSQ